MSEAAARRGTTKRPVTSGAGWSVCRVICDAGPEDRPFEERHAYSSVSAVLSGAFVYRSVRGRALMTPGSLLLGQLGAPFRCSHEHGRGDECLAFYFEPAWMEELAREIPGLKTICFGRSRIPPRQELAPLLAEAEALSRAGGDMAGEELALRFAGAALRFTGETGDVPVSVRDERRVGTALRLVEERLRGPVSVGELAAEAGMSRYHFLRVFHRTVGETPYRYVIGRRLALAARRLGSTQEDVLSVALSCGFGDLSEFIRHFRRRFGVTPSRYREQRRGSRL